MHVHFAAALLHCCTVQIADDSAPPPHLNLVYVVLIFLSTWYEVRQNVADEFGLDFDSLEDLQHLVDQVLSEKEDENGFLVFLRLAPVAKYLVEGYDFKMLNRYVLHWVALFLSLHHLSSRFVSYYTLSTHNFTSPSNNVTFHHSRLMGVSDIENAVSCLCCLFLFFLSISLTATCAFRIHFWTL